MENYKILLEKAKKAYNNCVTDAEKRRLESIFPELKESEDGKKPNGGIVLEDFNEGDGFYKVNLAYLSKEQVEEIENIVKKWNPELKESEDEDKVMKELLYNIIVSNDNTPSSKEIFSVYGKTKEDVLAWLEKQGKKEYALSPFKDEDVCKFMQYIENEAKAYEFNLPNRGYDIYAFAKDILIWLEKQDEKFQYWKPSEEQGEQKPAGKVEPKFKAGDWVVQGYNILKIRCVGNEYYCYETVGGYANDMLISEIDSLYHLWTIQDAKDGDILMANAPFIFNGNLKGGIGCPGAHCAINTLGKFQIPKYSEHWTGHTTTPATKKQQDLLFQKMKEAGYEWDADKKELKMIEQK